MSLKSDRSKNQTEVLTKNVYQLKSLPKQKKRLSKEFASKKGNVTLFIDHTRKVIYNFTRHFNHFINNVWIMKQDSTLLTFIIITKLSNNVYSQTELNLKYFSTLTLNISNTEDILKYVNVC